MKPDMLVLMKQALKNDKAEKPSKTEKPVKKGKGGKSKPKC